MELSKAYDPKKYEDEIYKRWEKSGFFNPDNLEGEPYTIIMPPPNANGALHVGHALFVAIEDVLIRYQRMRGRKTLWQPGSDHAAFETQVVFEKKLEKEGRSRFQIPQEQLYREIMEFTLANKKTMENQLKRLGASCDWTRKKFTLDEDVITVVYQTFEKLKNDGLLYKGKRVVNWCVKHQTSLSDVELKYEERKNPLYYVKYDVPELHSFITVATTRPETIPADVAIAVNPIDSRYENFIGKYAINPLNNEKILIISDKIVDNDFGTGALKITPDHDKADEEIFSKHPEINKESKPVINFFGKMEDEKMPAELAGLKVFEARQKAMEILKNNNRLNVELAPAGIDENYINNAALCYKCGSQIEPLNLANQWFVKMTEKPKTGKFSLKDLAIKAVKSGKIKFVPKRFEKIFFHWMAGIKDWNISRQIAWGIKIPDKGTADVFDTWFSSGQWPFAALMSAKKDDFRKFYPTDVMETGSDIIFFWVARMIMLGLYATGKAPFETVYLHGLVRDINRQKMSKSKGNVISPLEMSEKYGTDAVRMSLVVGNTPGSDPVVSEDKIRGYSNFANKIWNAARFVMMNLPENLKDIDAFAKKSRKNSALKTEDKKNLKELAMMAKKITKDMDNFKFYSAAERLYHYFWHIFADKIIESSKPRLQSNDAKDKLAAQYVLLEILKKTLILLHPFMPFITENIWQTMPQKNKNLLMIEKWPE